jgi:hypothetical protein
MMTVKIPDSFPASLLRAALEGLSMAELAAATGLPVRCVRRRLCAAAAVAVHRAASREDLAALRKALRRFLSAREVVGCVRVAAALGRQGRRGAYPAPSAPYAA